MEKCGLWGKVDCREKYGHTVDPIYFSRTKNPTPSRKIYGKLIEDQLAKVVCCAGIR